MKIFVLCDGGLGNQLFQYACARAHSFKTGGNVVLDPWRANRGRTRPLELQHFNINARFASTFETAICRLVDSSRLRPVAKIARKFVPGLIPAVVRRKKNDYMPQIFDVSGSIFMDGWFQTELYFCDYRERLLPELSFRDPPDRANAEWLEKIRNCDAVSLHVRRGDYISDPFIAKEIGTCSLEYYRAAIELIAQRLETPTYFVFSDDPEWTRQNLPVPEPRHFISHNFGKADREDMRLMSACKHFIIANSTFSWWGAWLATNPEKIVTAPRRWFANPSYSDKDIVPMAWIRV
jgi:hypothetical protein